MRRGMLLSLLVMAMGNGSAGAAEPSWLNGTPVIRIVSSGVPTYVLPTNHYYDCQPETVFITIPRDPLRFVPGITQSECGMQTAFGLMGVGSGLIQMNGAATSGRLKTSQGLSFNAVPIQNSPHVIQFAGSDRHILKDIAKNTTPMPQTNGELQYWLKPDAPRMVLKNAVGTNLNPTEMRTSSNGKWMVTDIEQRGLHRINLETGESLNFVHGHNHSNGIRPFYVSAISSTGRYAAVSESRYEIFKVYDLSTCTPPVPPSTVSNCRSVDLLPVAKATDPHFGYMNQIQFSTETTLRVYAKSNKPGLQHPHLLQSITAFGAQESMLDYLALGDSFASGEGAFSYRTGTDVRNPLNVCHLSSLSYPYLLSPSVSSTQSVACSGAKMKDITNGEYHEGMAQAKGRSDPAHNAIIYANYLPGYRPQLQFSQQNKPRNTTISIGGNDIGFGKIILACISPGTCYNTPQERLNLVHTINSKFNELVTTYSSLKDAAAVGGSIYILGYPSIVSSDGSCGLNVHLNSDEIITANQIVSHLNKVIQKATQKAGATYIDVENVLRGHRLCEAGKPSAVHGLTAGDDITFTIPIGQGADVRITGRESYHPTAFGHELYAKAIREATKNFSLPNPFPATVSQPSLADAQPLLGSGTNSLLPQNILHSDAFIDGAYVIGKQLNLAEFGFKPNSTVNAWINSSPTKLADFTTSAAGEAVLQTVLPSTIQPGLHIVHLYGRNLVNEPINVQRLVLVVASANDVDGDGTENNREDCILVAPSGIDEDKDGRDDACDGTFNTSAGSGAIPNKNSGPTVTTALFTPFYQSIAAPVAPYTASAPLAVRASQPLIPIVTEAVLGAATSPSIASTLTNAFNPLIADRPVNRNEPVFPWWILLLALAALYLLYRKWRRRT